MEPLRTSFANLLIVHMMIKIRLLRDACFCRPDDKSSSPSKLKKCSFNGVNLETGYLINGVSYAKRDWTVVYVENCDFKNCKATRSSQLINVMDSYTNLFRKLVDFEAVYR